MEITNENLFEQLQYVSDVANNVHPSFDENTMEQIESTAPIDFANRYKNNWVKDKDRIEVYLKSKDVLDTLEAFNLDASKFWFLCLFLKDYSEGATHGIVINTARDRITELKDNIKQGITYKVGKRKKELSDEKTLQILENALTEFLDNHKETNLLLDSAPFTGELANMAQIYTIFLFDKHLMDFLRPLKAKKEIHASKDKRLLVSRMVYILNMGSHIFYEEYKPNGDKLNYLKNYLNKYKGLPIKTINNHYF